MVQKIAAIDIGDLFYFGILIVGAIYSWIKKTKEIKAKPKERTVSSQNPAEQKSPQSKNPIDDFLKEILDQPILKEFSGQTKVEKQKQKQKVKKEYSFKEDYFEPIKKNKEPDSYAPTFQKSIKNTQPIEYFNGFEKKELNFRDMIILDAIMNRPYK